MKKKILAAVLSASLMSSTALAHTNSIGYVGDGNGGLNFWYGSWHDGTTFNEAEIKIEGTDASGNTITFSDGNGGTQTYSIDEFNLLSQDSPAGLISGVNYFTSDGTQLVAYDPTGASNGGTTQESYTWQGITYSNLAPGTYTFTYIPLGSTESSYPTGTPTMEWVPMDNVILSLGVTITQNDLDGDANNNGILDVNEVAVGAASGGPTVVSQGSSQVIGYIATTGGVIQVVQRTQTDTTWDNMSDGTTQNTQVTNTTLTPFEGRIDQVETAQDIVSSTLRSLTFDGVSGIGMNSKMNNGMSGSTRGFQAGGKKETDNGIIFGAGGAKLSNTLKGNDDSISSETDVIGLSIEKNNVELSVRHAMTDYDISRTIGDFSNTGKTNGTDTAISLTYTAEEGKLRPIFGYTRGKRTVEGYTEEGSIQTARTIEESSEMYNYMTVGGTFDAGPVTLTALHHTDGVNDVIVGIEKERGNTTFNLSAQRSMTDLGNTNSLFAGINIKF